VTNALLNSSSSLLSKIIRFFLLLVCYGSMFCAQLPDHLPIEAMVLCPPTPVRAEGKFHLVYEIHVTNFRQKDVTLRRVEVRGDNSAAPITTYEGLNLQETLSTPGRVTSEKARLSGGQRLVIFIWATLDSRDAIPKVLRHQLTFDSSAADGHQFQISFECAETPVRPEKAIVIRPPLKGGPWWALDGPSNGSRHRQAIVAMDGRTFDAQRFAIDWNRLGADGRAWSGDGHRNTDYYGFGSEILAVADGTITEVADGIPENIPRSVRPFTFDNISGNHIILDLGAGHYAFYAHMQPGKMRVRVGDHVHTGQVLGLLGNSGNSQGPHLHFHLVDRSSPLLSEGLPYVLDSFEVDGSTRTMEMPLANALVRFPDSH
jgi:murein DD-endopeptidase